mmetsp:Transcript_9162/g.9024  ORF Transcript_9162/g.9024 Transcript_9162/m.9024 type:complete len:569 (+) Transcript_9162:2-1708(+)
MQHHILECLDALSHAKVIVRDEKRGTGADIVDYEKLESAKDNVFASAISIILENEKSPYKRQEEVIQVFRNNVKLSGDNSWLPLHWAAACGDKVTEKDVKTIYAANPMELEMLHLKRGHEDCDLGHTPIGLLLMSKKPNLSLLLFLIKIHTNAFSIPVSHIQDPYRGTVLYYPLHIAAMYSESIEVIRMVIQVSTEILSTATCFGRSGGFPLGLLCKRDEFSGFWDIFSCLLEIDSSPEVIADAISCTIESQGYNKLKLIEMLLKANPESANYGYHLHEICQHIKGSLCLEALSLFIALDENAIREAESEVNDEGLLLIQTAARHNTVEVLEFILNHHPESALELVHPSDSNLLHLALKNNESGIDILEAKVKFLTSKYPILLQMNDSYGLTPFHEYLLEYRDLKMEMVSILIAVEKQIVAQSGFELSDDRAADVVDEDDNQNFNNYLSLPLHLVLKTDIDIDPSPVSEKADIIRLLIRLYPEGTSVKNIHDKYPYDYAIENKMNSYFIRILLRGNPNDHLLHDLNYAERRLAMFLAFRAVSRNMIVTIWANLRFENKDLLKKIISFL